MSPYADCPILELRRTGEHELSLVLPKLVFYPTGGRASTVHTATAMLCHLNSLPPGGPSLNLIFDPSQPDDEIDLFRAQASDFYRHVASRRGCQCPKCGRPFG